MNGKQVVEKIGITYPQLRYFTRRIDAITKKDTTQGHDNEYNYRDLVYLKLAAMMREDQLSLREVNAAIRLLDHCWTNADNPEKAGSLVRKQKEVWSWAPIRMERVISENADGEKITEIVTSIPQSMYSVGVIAKELSQINQMELIPEESVQN